MPKRKKKPKKIHDTIQSMRSDVCDIYGAIFNGDQHVDLRDFINNRLKKYDGQTRDAREIILVSVLMDVSNLLAEINGALHLKHVTLH